MPIVRGPGGSTMITGQAILGYRAHVLLSAIKLYLITDGKVIATRGLTVTKMLQIATEYTGKKYARSRKGLEKAGIDLTALMTIKTPDELGDVHAVNKELGGVAADLQETES